jgi:hypothetical protein
LGQSPEQTERDRYECHVWAVQETGVDPSRPGATPHERVLVQPAVPPGAGTAAVPSVVEFLAPSLRSSTGIAREL